MAEDSQGLKGKADCAYLLLQQNTNLVPDASGDTGSIYDAPMSTTADLVTARKQ